VSTGIDTLSDGKLRLNISKLETGETYNTSYTQILPQDSDGYLNNSSGTLSYASPFISSYSDTSMSSQTHIDTHGYNVDFINDHLYSAVMLPQIQFAYTTNEFTNQFFGTFPIPVQKGNLYSVSYINSLKTGYDTSIGDINISINNINFGHKYYTKQYWRYIFRHESVR
jgi:hypothetical protein